MRRKNHRYPTLKPLLAPDSIAVVGASEKAGPGRQVLENLIQLRYQGEIYPVNPNYDEILGMACFPSLTEVHRAGHHIEMVAILLNRRMVNPILKEAAEVGVRAGWAFANGFGEADAEGRALQKELSDICEQNNILFCGPNCVGYLNLKAGVGTYSAPAPQNVKLGNIGFIAQSGYLTISVANSVRGLGYSLLCSSGNEAVVDSTDFISYMLEDPGTEIIMAFIEQFRKPECLPELASRALEVGKPIILIKVGRSEMAKRATIAHTGALAGSDDVQDALFKKIGIVRVDDFDEMFETAELFSKLYHRLPKGSGIFSVSLSGGVISLIADLGEKLQLNYPTWSEEGKETLKEVLPPYIEINNPIDVWGFGEIEKTYETCLMAAAREEKADLIFISQDVPGGMAPLQVNQYAVVARAAVKVFQEIKKPVVIVSNPSVGFHSDISAILEKGNVPFLQGTREGLKAIKSLISYAAFKRGKEKELDEKEPAIIQEIPPGVEEYIYSDRAILNEYISKKVLNAYGIQCALEVLCKSEADAIHAAREIGYPVALKIVSPQIQHKTEAGGLKLNVRDEKELKYAYEELMKNTLAYDPSASIEGVLCQQMIGGAVAEAIAGILMDPSFGPAVVFGLGGIMVEILEDRALGIPPLSRDEALEMIGQTRASKLLTGFRGASKADMEALADALISVGRIGIDLSDRIEALDINPLLIMPEGQGVIAVDALIILKKNCE